MSWSKSGLALITVIIMVMLISMVAIAAINLMAGQALLTEHQIARIRTFYAVEAALQLNILSLMAGSGIQDPTTVDSHPVAITQTPDNGPLTTDTLTANLNY